MKKQNNMVKLSPETKYQHMHQLALYRKELYKKPELRSLFLEVTGYCNEHCRHCGSGCGDYQVHNQLTMEEICALLDQVKADFPIEKMKLCITGGEPLLRKDFFEIMEYAHGLGFSWGMTSNGTLITKEVAKKLQQTGMRTVSISVDGLEKTHDWFRQKDGSYKETMSGIRQLVKIGGFSHIQITTVVHKRNIDELETMYKKFSKLGIHSWRVVNIDPIGRAAKDPELLLAHEDYRRLLTFIREHRFAGKMSVEYGCSHFLGVDLEREVRPWYFFCNAGVYVASVMYNGDIGACLDIERRPELIFGNIRNDRLLDVWQQGFAPYRKDRQECEQCNHCEDYEFCGGDSFHTWNFDEHRPNICMKELLDM